MDTKTRELRRLEGLLQESRLQQGLANDTARDLRRENSALKEDVGRLEGVIETLKANQVEREQLLAEIVTELETLIPAALQAGERASYLKTQLLCRVVDPPKAG